MARWKHRSKLSDILVYSRRKTRRLTTRVHILLYTKTIIENNKEATSGKYYTAKLQIQYEDLVSISILLKALWL